MSILLNTRPTRMLVHGMVVALVGAFALVGHAAGLPHLTNWGGVVPMAIPTAFCFLLLGASQVEWALSMFTNNPKNG